MVVVFFLLLNNLKPKTWKPNWNEPRSKRYYDDGNRSKSKWIKKSTCAFRKQYAKKRRKRRIKNQKNDGKTNCGDSEWEKKPENEKSSTTSLVDVWRWSSQLQKWIDLAFLNLKRNFFFPIFFSFNIKSNW